MADEKLEKACGVPLASRCRIQVCFFIKRPSLCGIWRNLRRRCHTEIKEVFIINTLRDSANQFKNIRSIAAAGMLAALAVVLNQIVIPAGPMLEIGFAFLATAVSGFLFGPFLAGTAGIVADLAGYFLRPNGGFFIGFTLNEFIIGFIYGIFLYKKNVSKKRVILAVLTVTVLINLLLTPVWLYIMYGKSFFAALGPRLIKNAIMLPVNCIILYYVLKGAEKYKKSH